MVGLVSAIWVLVAGALSLLASLQPIIIARHRLIEMINLLIEVMNPCLCTYIYDQGVITFLLSLKNKPLDSPID
jgi:hypothetical protein